LQSGFNEKQVRNELFSEIGELEKNYETLKDILSGAEYSITDIKGTLQLLKENLSKINALFIFLSSLMGTKTEFSLNPLLNAFDSSLTMMAISPQTNPCDIIQMTLTFSNIKIENVMSALGIFKKILQNMN
jgi:histidinol phosphatase-like PHP family hydrolase